MMAKGALALDASTKERIFNIQSRLMDGWMDIGLYGLMVVVMIP